MQFSDTTNRTGIIQDCEFWSGLGKEQISGNTDLLQDFTRLINNRYDKYVMILLNSQDSWDFDDINYTDYPLLTANLVANQQDYTFPASLNILKIKRVEVTYDGSKWYKAEPLDVNELGTASDTTTIANQFFTTQPYFDPENNGLRLYPIPSANVTNGLKIWIYRNVDAFSTADTTQVPGFDRAYHQLLSLGASLDYMIQKGQQPAANLANKLELLEKEFIRHYGSKQKDPNMILKPAFVDYN